MTRAAGPGGPDPSIFKAYDIRGIADTQLGPGVPGRIGAAFVARTLPGGAGTVAVGRDGRLSSPRIADELVRGLRDAGADTVDIGLVPTPMLYEYALLHASGNGIMVTGSHNPKEHNGLKMMAGGRPVVDRDIQGLREEAEAGPRPVARPGTARHDDFANEYVGRVRDGVALGRRVTAVVDCGNGAAGVVAPRALRAVGCDIIELHSRVDGNFPNHHPDPSRPRNLEDCLRAVRESGAEIGIAFDGDGDRLGVVSPSAGMVYPDLVLMLYADDVLRARPGARVVYDVKCTRLLAPWIRARGGTPVMSRTGHSFIKRRMREEDAALGGEMSGHFFFRDRWSGYDDAIYAAARLLEIASRAPSASDALGTLPVSHASPEVQVDVGGAGKDAHEIVAMLARDPGFGDAVSVDRTDGLRVEFERGFGLVRPSNTTPTLVLRFEGDTPADLDAIRAKFRERLLQTSLFGEIDLS